MSSAGNVTSHGIQWPHELAHGDAVAGAHPFGGLLPLAELADVSRGMLQRLAIGKWRRIPGLGDLVLAYAKLLARLQSIELPRVLQQRLLAATLDVGDDLLDFRFDSIEQRSALRQFVDALR